MSKSQFTELCWPKVLIISSTIQQSSHFYETTDKSANGNVISREKIFEFSFIYCFCFAGAAAVTPADGKSLMLGYSLRTILLAKLSYAAVVKTRLQLLNRAPGERAYNGLVDAFM